MRRTPRSLKWRTLPVATVALRASAIPATWASRISTLLPACCLRATSGPAALAAGESKDRTRSSRSSLITLSKAPSRCLRRRDGGRSSKPVRISKSVTEVVQIDSEGWASSQSATTTSGTVRMSADSTFVSSRIMVREGRLLARGDHVARASLVPNPRRGTVTRSSIRAAPARAVLRERLRGGSRAPPPQWSTHALGPCVGALPSGCHRAGEPGAVPCPQ
jgi:hypothetical protein